MTYKIGDKIILKNEFWIDKFAMIVEIQNTWGYTQYALKFTNGSELRWINDSEISGLQLGMTERIEFT
jgi:hypothetical protein